MKITDNMRKGVMGRDPQGFCSTRFMVMHRAKDTKELVELLWKYRHSLVKSTYAYDKGSLAFDHNSPDWPGQSFIEFIGNLKGLSFTALYRARNLRKGAFKATFQPIVDQRMAEFEGKGARGFSYAALYRKYAKEQLAAPEFPLARWLLEAA